MHNDLLKVLLTSEAIALRVRELGTQISEDFTRLGPDEEIVLVPVLTGGIVFVADLMRQMPFKVRLSVATVSSYPRKATKSAGAEIIGELPTDLEDKHVLIVDDILDSGRTIRRLRTEISERNPLSVRVCVLLRKTVPSALQTPCEYVGFDIPDEFVVGYGLDYDNYYRNLPEVAVLKKDVM